MNGQAPQVHTMVPLSEYSRQLVRRYSEFHGGDVTSFVRVAVTSALQRGTAPDPGFTPNGHRLSVMLPAHVVRSPRVMGGLLQSELRAYVARLVEHPGPRSRDVRRIDVEIPGEVSERLRMAAFREGTPFEEHVGSVVSSVIEESGTLIGQMGRGYEIHTVRVPTDWYPAYARLCRDTDLIPADILGYHLAARLLRGRFP